MSLTPSTMVPLGTPAPDFALDDAAGKRHRLDDAGRAPALVVAFLCNHCPYVKLLKQHFADLARTYQERGVACFAINSNDAENYPEDAPARMLEDTERYNYPFPYLVDASQDVARAYQAACTPDFFVYDGERRLAYRGQYDNARPGGSAPVTGADLAAALDALLAGEAVPEPQQPATGCNIKWKTA